MKENPEKYDNTKGPGAKNSVVDKWKKLVSEMRKHIAGLAARQAEQNKSGPQGMGGH